MPTLNQTQIQETFQNYAEARETNLSVEGSQYQLESIYKFEPALIFDFAKLYKQGNVNTLIIPKEQIATYRVREAFTAGNISFEKSTSSNTLVLPDDVKNAMTEAGLGYALDSFTSCTSVKFSSSSSQTVNNQMVSNKNINYSYNPTGNTQQMFGQIVAVPTGLEGDNTPRMLLFKKIS